jgi:hypothetical protein
MKTLGKRDHQKGGKMTRVFPFVRYRLFIFLFLVLLVVAGLSGCTSLSASSQQVVCTPNPSTVNVYRVTPQPWTNLVFQYAATPIVDITIPSSAAITTSMPGINPPSMPPSELQIQGSRYAAFQYLIDETKRWSDIETIKLDDLSEAQIVITFISPELLQTVFLSEVLEQRVFYSDFEAKTQAMLNAVAARDELLFLLTITTTSSGRMDLPSHSIDIPIRDMALTNGEDLPIKPKHDDHNLDQPINSSSRSVFGYLAYPLAVMTNSECKWVLEPKYNTNIVITVPVIQVDGVNSGPYTWTIPYMPLIEANILPNIPMFVAPPGFDQTLIAPMISPPNGIIDQTNNWQDFARFVWNQITLGNY